MNELLQFYRDIHKIKHTERKGWIKIGVQGTKDTIASHSYGASLLGWILSSRANLDANKIIKMLLIHDLIMAHIEDFLPSEDEYASKREREKKAAQELLNNIPSEIKEEFKSLFDEYQAEETEEAILARECDKLDTLLQSLMYSKQLNKNELAKFLTADYRKKFRSETGKAVLRQLEEINLQ